MNLRHLILTTDPNSFTSPKRVLDRWKDRMSIELFSDERFLSSDFEDDVHERTVGENGKKQKDSTLQYHRARQAAFNMECLKEHKRKKRGWTMVIDVDEYMTLNPYLGRLDLGWNVPPVKEPGSVATVLKDLKIPNPDFEELTTPCVPVYRRQLSARESRDDEVNAMAPAGFDGNHFQTMRWRKYGSGTVNYKTRLGKTCQYVRAVPNKVIIDLGRLQLQDLDHPKNQGNPHVPLKSICPSAVYLPLDETPLMVNHYMGTREQWLYRVGDKRGKFSWQTNERTDVALPF